MIFMSKLALLYSWIRLAVELMKQGSKLPGPVRAAEARACLNRNLCVLSWAINNWRQILENPIVRHRRFGNIIPHCSHCPMQCGIVWGSKHQSIDGCDCQVAAWSPPKIWKNKRIRDIDFLLGG